MAGIIVKSNPTSGSTPDPQYLAVGELAFNSYDGRLFSKKHNGELVLLNYKPNPTASIADTANSSSYALTASFALNGGSGGSGGTNIYVGAMREIASVTTITSQSSVTFDNIPATYKDLIVMCHARGTSAVAEVGLNARLNGDTGSNYSSVRENRFGTDNQLSTSSFVVTTINGATTPTQVASLARLTVPDYTSTQFQKTLYGEGTVLNGTSAINLFTQRSSGRWTSSSAVTRLTVFTGTGEFVTGSTITLYGIGGESSNISISGSLNLLGSITASAITSPSITGSLFGTASFALNASAATPINTGSFATTGSNIFVGNQTITGSLTLSSSLPAELRVIGDAEITGSLRTSGLTVVSGSLAVSSPNTLVLGSQIFYPQSSNGFSVNENYDPSNNSSQVAYHFTTGESAKTSVVFSLARTANFTNMFGVTGSIGDNKFVIGSEFAGTDFEFRSNVGLRPANLQGGNLLARITRTGQLSATSFTSSLVNQVGFLGTSSWAQNSTTASTATSAATASLLLGSIESASYAATASVLLGSIQSASYAVTASFALNGGTGGGSSVSASWASSSISASFATSASFANTAITSSYALTSLSGITVNLTGSTVGVNVYRSASLTLTDNNLNYIPFTTERRDDLNFWDISDPTKLIVPNGADGWYTISGYCHWNANTGLGRRIWIVVDGTETVGYSSTVAYFEHNDPGTHAGAVVYLTSGSFVQLGVSENDGDNVAINASASIGMVRIGSSTNVPSASFATTASYALNSNQSQTSLSRGTVSANVASIAPNQNYTGSISLGKTFMLLSTQVNTDVRLRLYGSQSYLNNDLTRPIGTDPTNNSGIITDLILSGSPTLYNYTLSPIANGANMDPVTVSTIYYTVTNLSGITTDISMSFNRIVLE